MPASEEPRKRIYSTSDARNCWKQYRSDLIWKSAAGIFLNKIPRYQHWWRRTLPSPPPFLDVRDSGNGEVLHELLHYLYPAQLLPFQAPTSLSVGLRFSPRTSSCIKSMNSEATVKQWRNSRNVLLYKKSGRKDLRILVNPTGLLSTVHKLSTKAIFALITRTVYGAESGRIL